MRHGQALIDGSLKGPAPRAGIGYPPASAPQSRVFQTRPNPNMPICKALLRRGAGAVCAT